MTWKGIRQWLMRHMRTITYVKGSSLVAIWTIIRHLTNGVNFDVVGQVGVADQWARGLHNGAQLGATNYLLKMPIYYLVNHFGFLSPHLKLLTLALIFNITTFILLVFLFEKMLRLYDIRPGLPFYLAMLWLASISGRIYWLDYANSRNLETVGGVLVLYLALRLLKQITWQRMAWVIGVGGIVFFADQLQMYAIGGGLVLYAILLLVNRRTKAQLLQSGIILSTVAGAIIVAKVVLLAATMLLPITFLTAPRVAPVGSLLHTLVETIRGVAVSTARIFDASFYASGSGPNLLREALNMLILVSIIGIIAYSWQKVRLRSIATISLCCILSAYAAYALSYQALQPITERYIVMVPLLVALLFGSVTDVLRAKWARRFYTSWAAALGISAVLAMGALAVSWPTHYSKDAYIPNALSFLHQNDYTLAVSSRDGIPETYFAQGSAIVLPTICQPDHTLIESNLFYDRAAFAAVATHHGYIPLIVPGDGIRSGDSVCSLQDIERQFGLPSSEVPVSGIGIAMLYRPSNLQVHE